MSRLSYNQLAAEIHANSVKHGWWENQPSIEHFLTLVVCELADAAIRLLDIAGAYNWSFNKPIVGSYSCIVSVQNSFTENIGGIMASVCNRALASYDRVIYSFLLIGLYAKLIGIDLEWHIKHKMQYNANRPYKHGKAY